MTPHTHGLIHDLQALAEQDAQARERRQALRWLGASSLWGIGGTGLLSLSACGGGGDAT
jgi:hypothetical protein